MSVIQRVGEQEVVLVDRLTPPSQQELVLFVRTLRTALLSYNLYPPGHAVTRRRMSEFIQQMMPLFRDVGVLVLACKRDGLEVNDQHILQNVPEREVARELSYFLELRGVRNIVIHAEVTFDDLEGLFTRWVKKPADPRAMHTYWQHGFRSSFLRFNLALANRSEMVINDGLNERPIEISKEALLDAVARAPLDSLTASPDPLPVVQGNPADQPRGFEQPARPVAHQARVSPQHGGYGGGGYNSPQQSHAQQAGRMSGAMQASQFQGGRVSGAMQAGQFQGGRVSGAMQAGQFQDGRASGAISGGMAADFHQGQEGRWQGQPYHSQHSLPQTGGMPTTNRSGAMPTTNRSSGMPHLSGHPQQGAAGQVYSTQERAWGNQGQAQRHPHSLSGEIQHGGINPHQSNHFVDPLAVQPQTNRAADAFSTGQFSPAMQAQLQSQLRAQHEAQQAGYGHSASNWNQNPHHSQASMSPAHGAGAPMGRGADAFSTGQFRPYDHTQKIQRQQQPGAHLMQTGMGPASASMANMGGYPQQPAGHHPMELQLQEEAPHRRGQQHPYSLSQQPAAQANAQPFNPFTSSQAGGGRGADVFSTGQFNPAMQAELRAQHEAQQAPAPSASPINLQRIAVDPDTFDRRPPPFAKLDYRQIDPISLFRSRRFQEFLAKGGVSHYLSIYMPPGGIIEQTNGMGIVTQEPWSCSDSAQDLFAAIDSLPHPQLKEQMYAQIGNQMAHGNVGQLEEKVLQLGEGKHESILRKELLNHIPTEHVPELGQRLLRKMVRAEEPRVFDEAGDALHALVDMQRKRNDWTPLVATLESLKQLRWDNRSESWVREKAADTMRKMVSSRIGQQLLYQALCGEKVVQEQARYGLAAMGVDSAPIFIESLRQLQRRKDLESMLALLQEVSQQFPSTQKRLFFGRLWAERASLGDHQQMVLLKTMQQMAPDTLEKFLLKEIRYAEEQGQEEHLLNCVRQAILFHTPGLRQVLLDLLRTRRFALYQEIEENILRVLDRNQTVQTVRLLDDMIHSPQTDIALRASTVWLLGSIKRPEALTLLSTILTSRSRFLRKHRYSKELRLQAIDTLRHFQWDNLTELLDKVKKDGDREVRQYAEQMLEAERGFTFM